MKNHVLYNLASTLLFSFFFSGDVKANESHFGVVYSDTSKPKTPIKRLWRDYLNDTSWEVSDNPNNPSDHTIIHSENDGCHHNNMWKLSYKILKNEPLPHSYKFLGDSLVNRDTLLSKINSMPWNKYIKERFVFWYGDTVRKFNPLKQRITPHASFYFPSAHPLNSNQWLFQSQNFLGFRAQYGITNYISAGISRDFSGYWIMSNIALSPIQYRGYALSLSAHGGKYFPLNSKIWGLSINQTFVSKYTKTSVRISTNELKDIKDARKENLTINFSHIQRINATWSMLSELAYLPGKVRQPMVIKNEWRNADQLEAPHALDQYTYLIGLRKVMGRKTQFDFGIQTVSVLGEIYTESSVPIRSFVEKWTIVLPFPFINISMVL